jgi:hypothetical protein
VSGVNNEVIAQGTPDTNDSGLLPADRLILIDTAAGTIAEGQMTAYRPRDRYSRTDRSIIATWEQNVGHSSDYVSQAPGPKIAAGADAAVCNNGQVYAIGSAGIVRLDDFLTSPVAVQVAGGSTVYSQIISGSKQRGVVALCAGLVTSFDGQQWASVAWPSSLTSVGALGLREV